MEARTSGFWKGNRFLSGVIIFIVLASIIPTFFVVDLSGQKSADSAIVCEKMIVGAVYLNPRQEGELVVEVYSTSGENRQTIKVSAQFLGYVGAEGEEISLCSDDLIKLNFN